MGLNVHRCWAEILGTINNGDDDDDVGLNVLRCQANIFGTTIMVRG